MTFLIFILITIVCVILGLIVLIQNPKGGGLSGTLAGFNNQFMGVKQTTDVLEKGTWIMGIALLVLCVGATFFTPKANKQEKIKTMSEQAAANGGAPVVPNTNPEPASNPLTPGTK